MRSNESAALTPPDASAASARSWTRPGLLMGLLICLLLVVAAGTSAAGCASAARERLGLGLAPPISVAMIVHGTDGDPFWAEVNSGAIDAARAFDVNLLWRSTPDTNERVRLINEIIQQGFDVLVVSLPDPEGISEVIADAIVVGTTVYVVNVGSEIGAELGADSYFGQIETVAGLAVGDRLVDAGATHLLCILHERNNIALTTRCQRAGSRVGRVTNLFVDPANGMTATQISDALALDPSIDSMLTMNTAVMNAASDGLNDALDQSDASRVVVHAVFELNDSILDAIEEGRVAFAVDQQPYLQGYLPVAYSRLVQYAEVSQRYEQGDELADAMLQWIAGSGILLGPGFVDNSNLAVVRAAVDKYQQPTASE